MANRVKKAVRKAGIVGGSKIKRGELSRDDWLELDEWVNVKSSNVARIRYRWDQKQLFVDFKNGGRYVYWGVLPQTAKAFYNSPSMGQFVHYRLKDKYVYQKLG